MNKIEPPDPIDEDLYELVGHDGTGSGPTIQSTPGSLAEVLDALQADHEFLLRGGVFTRDVIDEWIAYKREREVDAVALRPHPYEFHLYYDI
jgi:glutamine synthetase